MRRLAGPAIALLAALVALPPPASAAGASRPIATLLGTGTIVTEEGVESYIEVVAHDTDGIITEIEVWWGDRSVTFAHSYPCLIPPTPSPGDPHRFLVSHGYQKPGHHTARYVVHSISDCSGTGSEQHSRPHAVRLVAP